MRLSSRAYLVIDGVGDRDRCFEVMREMLPRLKTFHASNPKTTCSLKILSSEEDLINESVDEFGIPGLIDNKFPVVYLNVTYDVEVFIRDNLKVLEAEFDLLHFASGGVIDDWD